MKTYKNLFNKIISLENLFSAWDTFKSDKRNKVDVQRFEFCLEENIFKLRRELQNKTYEHGQYTGFYIRDPKQRHIHKATVRDRILHHAIFSVANPIFEQTFIQNSFSCRVGFGSHKGIRVLEQMTRKVSGNGTKPCFILKCDVKKFFDAVDHKILISILKKRIRDTDTIWLLEKVIRSFLSSCSNLFARKGLPIGNLTSQLFANIYMNESDQFIKHDLKVKYYCRYTDDFTIVSDSRDYLSGLIPKISSFLRQRLQLEIHPKKISINKFQRGIDFLGYIVFPHYRILRAKTRQRIFKKLNKKIAEYKSGVITNETLEQSLQSYLGVLSHADSYKLSQKLKNQFWFWLNE
ncbi:MAG: group II intron reverse transcriptase domain-containing protein [Parcubacteria group bacterium]|nr:group II intron reverse transcriptase domain-containing protein [Parcubacteria group bacterium]